MTSGPNFKTTLIKSWAYILYVLLNFLFFFFKVQPHPTSGIYCNVVDGSAGGEKGRAGCRGDAPPGEEWVAQW